MKKTFLIGEVADYLGVSADTLRLYERMGIVSPAKAENGYRVYSREDVVYLDHVMRLKRLGLPLKELRELSRRGSVRDAERTLELRGELVLEHIEELKSVYECTRQYHRELVETRENLNSIVITESPHIVIRLEAGTLKETHADMMKLGRGVEPHFCTLTSADDMLADDDRFNPYDYNVRNSALKNAVAIIDRDNAVKVPDALRHEFIDLAPCKCAYMAACGHAGTDYEAFVRLRRFMLDGGYRAAGDMICVFIAVRGGPNSADDYYQVYFPIE